MAENMSDLQKTPEQIRAQFQAQAAAILAEGTVLGSFQHRGVAGIEREQPIRRFLSGHLPGRFLVGQGSIASAEVILPNQHDIIVADRDASFTLLNTVSAQLFPIESVHLVVEVRTNFGDLEGVAKSLRAVRNLRSSAGIRQLGGPGSDVGSTAPPVHTVVAYEGPKAETALGHLAHFNTFEAVRESRLPIDFMLVLSRDGQPTPDSGYLIGYQREADGRRFQHHYYPISEEAGLIGPVLLKSGPDAFGYWYAAVLNHLSGVIAYPPMLYSYLGDAVEISEWKNRPY
jgi:hypothetical protein